MIRSLLILLLSYGASSAADGPFVEYPARATYERERLVVHENFSDGGTFTGPKTVRIYLPPGYHGTDERYRVLYFFDGWLVFSKYPNTEIYDTMLDVDKFHDELVAEGLIHPAILVAVDRGAFSDRRYELTPPLRSGPSETEGGLEENYRFITTYLKPHVDTAYRTLAEPEFTGVAGRSFGGIAAFYLAYSHPETFGLAGCMSVSFGWDEQAFYKEVLASDGPKSGTRFWIQDGTYDSWGSSILAAQTLKRRGWVEGDDLAYFHVHWGRHGQKAWNYQMRQMLHFLLRKEMPDILDIRVTNVADDRGDAIDLGHVGAQAFAMVDVRYGDGLRLNAIDPVVRTADVAVATVEADSLRRIRNVGPGWTTLEAEVAGRTASVAVKGYDPEGIERHPLPKAEKPIAVDGNLEEWPSLDHVQYRYPHDAPDFRFGVRHEDDDLYIAVYAYDDDLYTDPDARVLQQDTIEFWLDARPDPDRSESRAQWAGWDHLYFALSPGEETIVHRARRGRRATPDGFEAVCVPADSGFVAEVRIPGAYLDEKQESRWTDVRLNLCHIISDGPATEGKALFWQPNWVGEYNRVGSGTFSREFNRRGR